MTKGAKLTVIFIVAVVIVAGLFDIGVAFVFGGNATISHIVSTYSHKYPIIAYAGGLLSGHFWARD